VAFKITIKFGMDSNDVNIGEIKTNGWYIMTCEKDAIKNFGL
jgi:hypothetical protein